VRVYTLLRNIALLQATDPCKTADSEGKIQVKNFADQFDE